MVGGRGAEVNGGEDALEILCALIAAVRDV